MIAGRAVGCCLALGRTDGAFGRDIFALGVRPTTGVFAVIIGRREVVGIGAQPACAGDVRVAVLWPIACAADGGAVAVAVTITVAITVTITVTITIAVTVTITIAGFTRRSLWSRRGAVLHGGGAVFRARPCLIYIRVVSATGKQGQRGRERE